MRLLYSTLVLAAFPAAYGYANAGAAPDAHSTQETPKVEVKLELSYTRMSGNYSYSNVVMKPEFIVRPGQCSITISGGYTETINESVTTSRETNAATRTECSVWRAISVFGQGSDYRDPISGVVRRDAAAVGADVRLIKHEHFTLNLSQGFGPTWELRTSGTQLHFPSTDTSIALWTKRSDIEIYTKFTYIQDVTDTRNWLFNSGLEATVPVWRLVSFQVSLYDSWKGQPDVGKKPHSEYMAIGLKLHLPRGKKKEKDDDD